jgi:murein DD-endopeptidase MepM/ murein hydrolase activator NlpD
MKEREKQKDEAKMLREEPKPLMNKRAGFYVALYSCVGLMLTLAVIIGFNRFANPNASGTDTRQDTSRGSVQLPTAAPTARPPVQLPSSNLPSDENRPGESGSTVNGHEQAGQTNNNQPGNQQATNNQPGNQQAANNQPGGNPADNTAQNNGETETVTAQNDTPTADNVPDDYYVPVFGSDDPLYTVQWPQNDFVNETPDFVWHDDFGFGSYDEEYGDDCCCSSQSDQPLLMFTAEDRFSWPVFGDIIMEYSTTSLVFNPTLNSWRINDNVAISSPEGSQVQAAADGRVADILSTRERGKTVVIEHGNGWSTTYSQLQSDVAVSVGDVVERGQTIGYVGKPTMYSYALAPHVMFRVLQDDVTVNPRSMMAARG